MARNIDNEKILSDTETGYDLIADKFSSTRSFMWRDLGFIKDYVGPNDSILDFGCGNGRLAGFLEKNYKEYIGIDISQKLIDIAKQKYDSEKNRFVKLPADFKSLPFKDNYFDAAFSIAVFHHFPSREYAEKIAKELYRVMQPDGKLIISVWNLWQYKFLKNYFSWNSRKGLGWKDLNISFKDNQGNTFQRYHHIFSKRELKKIICGVGYAIERIENNGRNYISIFRNKVSWLWITQKI